MKKIIAITNQKGGVGKTTTALSLIGALHLRKYKVLGVDLDPQGSLGFSAGLDIENCDTIYDVLKGRKAIDEVIVDTDIGDFLPSNILLSTAELEFNMPAREFLLRDQLVKIVDDYDFIIIDTARHTVITNGNDLVVVIDNASSHLSGGVFAPLGGEGG